MGYAVKRMTLDVLGKHVHVWRFNSYWIVETMIGGKLVRLGTTNVVDHNEAAKNAAAMYKEYTGK